MKVRLRRAAAYLTAILLLSLCACSSPNTVARRGDAKEKGLELEVYFFAAGKADAILLTTEKSAVLIDCGKKGFGQTILEELNARGITRIDYLIITHFDQDHVGGAAKVINSIPIGCVVQNDRPGNSEAYEKYLRALDKAKVEPFTVNDSLTFVLDDVSFTVDPPQKDSYKHDNSNNSSLIVTVSCGEKTLLFMGDVQTERLKEFISTKAIDCDLLKLPHHGGADMEMEELITATMPEYAVICCSREEPDTTSSMQILREYGVSTFMTSEAPVQVTCDGSSLTVQYEQEKGS